MLYLTYKMPFTYAFVIIHFKMGVGSDKKPFLTNCEKFSHRSPCAIMSQGRSFWYHSFAYSVGIILYFFQMDNPESIFLPKDPWCLWLCWDHLAKPLPSLP